MDQKLAQDLFNEGAFVLVKGVPVGTEFGMDLATYQVDANFRGFKMIPPGVHIVFSASVGPYGDVAPRIGVLHFFKKQEVIVLEWNESSEELKRHPIKEEEAQLFRENIKDLDKYLAPYDYETLTKWTQLTNTITEATVLRCNSKCGLIRSNIELESCPDEDRPRGQTNIAISRRKRMDEFDLLPFLKPIAGTAPTFTSIPPKIPADASPQQITIHSLDCEMCVNEIMKLYGEFEDLLKEIQLSFILFSVVYSVESFVQWRIILNRLSGSEKSISTYKEIYVDYLEILSHQLPHLPVELLEPNKFNTVYRDVNTLVVNAFCAGLGNCANKLNKRLGQTIGWIFEMEDDPEDQPVIVDLEN